MNSYKIDDIVLYGNNGVCRVCEIEERELGEYYILRPVHNERTKLLVPTGNEHLVSRIRPIPSARELKKVIRQAVSNEPEWIADATIRKSTAHDILDHGTEFDLLMLTRSFHEQKQRNIAEGRKTTTSDSTILKNALKQVRDEFSVVLKIDQAEVDDFLLEQGVCARA